MLTSMFYRFKRMMKHNRRIFSKPTRVLHGAEQSWRPAAIFLPEQLSKVTAVQEETNMAFEEQRILGGEVVHGPTQAYQLHNAKVVNGFIYSDEGRLVITPQRERSFSLRSGLKIKKALLASSYNGNRYFGHWLSDDCARALIGDVFGPPLFTGLNWTHHQHDYRRLLGLEMSPPQAVFVETLTVIPDVGQNGFKRKRLGMIREALRCMPGPRGGRGVFVKRGNSGKRRVLMNEDKVAEHLAHYGFEIVDPSRDSLSQLMGKIRDADMVVGVEGSQLMHAVFGMAPGGCLVTIQPPDRFNNVLKDLTDALGNRYAFVVGEPRGGDFEVDLKSLMLTLDLVSQSMAPPAMEIA